MIMYGGKLGKIQHIIDCICLEQLKQSSCFLVEFMREHGSDQESSPSLTSSGQGFVSNGNEIVI